MRAVASSAVALTLALLAGCTWTTKRPEPPRATTAGGGDATSADEQAAAQPTATAVPTATAALLPPSEPIMPRIAVESSEGADKNVMLAAFEATSQPLSQCQGQGLMRIRVRASDEQTAFNLQPGSTMAEGARECVLKELSVIDIEEVVDAAAGSSPSDRPLGVDTVLVISFP